MQLIPKTIMVNRRKLVHGNKKHKDKREHWLRRVGNNLRHAELEMFWGVRIEYSFKQQNLRGKKKVTTMVLSVLCVYAHSCPILFDPMDCNQPGSSIHRVFQARILFSSFSVQFSHSVVSDSLQPHESQHAMPPCPSPTPGVHSDSHPSSQ